MPNVIVSERITGARQQGWPRVELNTETLTDYAKISKLESEPFCTVFDIGAGPMAICVHLSTYTRGHELGHNGDYTNYSPVHLEARQTINDIQR